MLPVLTPSIPHDFRGAARRLDEIDIPRIAATINVGEDELRALMEVESRGHGFDRTGRPLILFEPHIFYRLLGAGKKRDSAVRAGLAYARWGTRPYPRDSYPRLHKAMEIDADAALRSASWGLPQILGDNFRKAGFSSVEEMVAAFCEDEELHVAAMVQFLKSSRLDDELREHRWAALARGCNGPGYAKHGYHTRLAAAFARWQKKPDLDIRAAAKHETRQANTATFVDRARTKAVQERLAALGYHMVGRPDGYAGPRTAAAVAAFQKENGLPITGEISAELIEHIDAAEPLAISDERAEGEPEGSRIVAAADQASGMAKAVGFTGAMGGAAQALSYVEEAKQYIDRANALFEPVKSLIVDFWPVLLLGGAGYFFWKMYQIKSWRIEDHQSGKTA